MKKHSGFTLIELMVVMAIIAILATAGLTAYSNYLKKARDASRVQIARQIMTAVEGLSNGGSLPSVADLTTYLQNEGFAYTLPMMHPLVARVSGIVDNILGTTFALPDLDPLSGQPTCINSGGAVFAVCAFGYFVYSDGTYIISYGVEHMDSINNFWAIDYIVGGTTLATLPYPSGGGSIPQLFANVIGTNPSIISTNVSTYWSTQSALNSQSPGVVMTDGDIISDVSGFGAGS